ncbi:MAG: helix-turn-helix transcriptional regulator [Clostridia bacterium]|nr:helix-turn-helix transcriptional regulator [Clostridia bacterium]
MEFGQKLKSLRKERKISQMDLAKSTGISQSAIAKWELGKTEPTASALIKISTYFSESVDYLLGLKNN